jgi:hypothetical protein
MQNAPDFLLSSRRDITSQFGEDGIIEEIFTIIGEESRWAVELGALNGTHDSNVWSLVKEKDWSAVLIEADPTYFEKLKKEYADKSKAVCINAFVSFEGKDSLDALFARTQMPKSFDLFSLDIDGNEYHLWDSLTEYRPRVMVIEFNPSIPNSVSFTQSRDMNIFQGASLRAFVELGKKKGYELVAANDTNAFFVLAELFPKFLMDNSELDAVHTDHSYETIFFQLYDGTLKLVGNTNLIWHNIPIDEKRIQILPKGKRHYPARISQDESVRRFKQWARTLPIYAIVQKLRKVIGS